MSILRRKWVILLLVGIVGFYAWRRWGHNLTDGIKHATSAR